MPTTVNFIPAGIYIGVGTSIGSTSCGVLSAPVNVTASISNDTSGGALTLLSVKSFITVTELEVPDPGELPSGTKPPPPVKIQVPVQQGQSNGVTPLAVASGQYVEVDIQFAPTASTPDTSTATLLISGDTWNPVSIPITAKVGELSVSVPSIRVKSGQSATLEVTVKSVAGPKTTAKLTPFTSMPTEVRNVTVTPPSSTLSIGKGQSVTAKFTVSAEFTDAGTYDWAIAVLAFDNAQSFSVGLSIIVEEPYYCIKSKLDGNVIGIAGASTKSGAGLDASPQKGTGADNQLWQFVIGYDPSGVDYYCIQSKLNGNVIEIDGGGSLVASPLKESSVPGTGSLVQRAPDNQLWQFISDPAGSDYFFIVSNLNGNVIDIKGASTAAGASLDAYPLKVTSWDNQNQLWAVVGGKFPSVVKTLPPLSKGLDYTIILMLWGPPQPPGQTKWPSTLTGPDLSSALTEIAAAGYFRLMAQYNVKEVKIAGPPTALTTPPWPPGNSQFTTLFKMSDVQNVITTSFSSGVPSPDKFSSATPMYIVITPRGGSMTDYPSSLGEHGTFSWGPANKNVIYAYVGAQSDLNDTIVVATHEIAEALGDNGGAPKELCDHCQTLTAKEGWTPEVGTFTVESYFDAATNQCVAPPSFHKPST